MSVLLTGATGFLGGLIVAQLLARTSETLLLPIRAHHRREDLLTSLRARLLENGYSLPENFDARVVTLPFTSMDEWKALRPREIIHCAGCLDYFDKVKLKEVNLDLTQALLDLGCELSVERFLYISTAFSCGYTDISAAEALHGEPPEDPTDYTRTKRQAEQLIADSGIPFLILRPSIVIGDSRDGHYGGKPYGIYQVIGGYERLLCDRYLPTLHAVAPRTRLHLIHQDAFQEGFFAAYQKLPPGSIVHLVSRPETLPTVRDLYEGWMEICAHPHEVYFYPEVSQVPLEEIDHRERILIEFAEVNIEIAAHAWKFETSHLDGLRRGGLHFVDATPETLRVCLENFAARSPRIQNYLQKFRGDFAPAYRAIEIGL